MEGGAGVKQITSPLLPTPSFASAAKKNASGHGTGHGGVGATPPAGGGPGAPGPPGPAGGGGAGGPVRGGGGGGPAGVPGAAGGPGGRHGAQRGESLGARRSPAVLAGWRWRAADAGHAWGLTDAGLPAEAGAVQQRLDGQVPRPGARGAAAADDGGGRGGAEALPRAGLGGGAAGRQHGAGRRQRPAPRRGGAQHAADGPGPGLRRRRRHPDVPGGVHPGEPPGARGAGGVHDAAGPRVQGHLSDRGQHLDQRRRPPPAAVRVAPRVGAGAGGRAGGRDGGGHAERPAEGQHGLRHQAALHRGGGDPRAHHGGERAVRAAALRFGPLEGGKVRRD